MRRLWSRWWWLAVLHCVTSARYLWDPDSLLFSLLYINPDVLGLFVIGCLATRLQGRRALVDHLLTIAVLFVPVYRFGFSIVPAFYGKPFDPYHDILMLPGLLHLLTHERPGWQHAVGIAAAAVVVGLCYVVVYRAWRCGMRQVASARGMPWRASAFGAVVFGMAAWNVQALWPVNDSMFVRAGRYVVNLWSSERWRTEERFLASEAIASARLQDVPQNLDGLDGADVYLLFVESYGRAVFHSQQARAAFDGWSARLGPEIVRHGFSVVSRFMRPSIAGGLSSLAHAELLTGMEVDNRRVFDRLLTSQLRPLPKIFAASGYHAINAQPAMTADWAASNLFFGFTEDRFNDSLPYDGPWFSWGFMPDQYALQRLLDSEVRTATQPLFMQFVSVSSHAPFTRTPHYYANWSDAVAPDAYVGTDAAVFPISWLNYVGHPDVGRAYLSTVGYSLQTAVGFCGELERRSLVIVVGDHQPPVAGELMHELPTKDVPCHVLTNDAALLEPFRANGFVPGLRPSDEIDSLSFALFPRFLLSAFGR